MSDWFGFKIPTNKRIFLCKKPYTSFKDMTNRQRTSHKPEGLWYAHGDAWVEWAEGNIPESLEESHYLYEVQLHPKQILTLSTKPMLKAFDSAFKAKNIYGFDFAGEYSQVDWPDVATGWAGIEIIPWQRYPRPPWYNSWDVASGCVWGEQGVKSIKLLHKR